MTDWVTISALATAGGTLVLAAATFASVRSSNRSARVAEEALLAAMRPLLMPSRLEDSPVKVGFADNHFVVDLDDADTRCMKVAGKAGAVAAGPFDTHELDTTERAQPVQQLHAPALRRRELLHAQQAAYGIERSGDMDLRVGVHAPRDGTALYDGQGHPFLCVGVACTCWSTRPCEPDL
jgi:hypothetical protein